MEQWVFIGTCKCDTSWKHSPVVSKVFEVSENDDLEKKLTYNAEIRCTKCGNKNPPL